MKENEQKILEITASKLPFIKFVNSQHYILYSIVISRIFLNENENGKEQNLAIEQTYWDLRRFHVGQNTLPNGHGQTS